MSYELTLWDRITLWWNRNVTKRLYWLKCCLFKKYNHLRIRTLPPTWTDRDQVLTHAMFQVLSDFMEKEKAAEVIDWVGSSEEHAHAWKEIQELYEWWNNVYLKFDVWKEAPIRDEFEPKTSFIPVSNGLSRIDQKWDSEDGRKEWEADWDRHTALEEDMERQLTENCIRLIKVRKHLWT